MKDLPKDSFLRGRDTTWVLDKHQAPKTSAPVPPEAQKWALLNPDSIIGMQERGKNWSMSMPQSLVDFERPSGSPNPLTVTPHPN